MKPRHLLRSGARALFVALLAAPLPAQFDPFAGEWGKSDAEDVRVMTWNVEDALCSSNAKTEADNGGFNNWHACARIVAALRPDVLIVQEAGDNSGNGTGSGVDSLSVLTAVVDLFLRGGSDPFLGGAVTAYVEKYAPGYDLPYLYVSGDTDGFNRNLILSRFPFADLNGDGRTRYDDLIVAPVAYAPGGGGGIRGFTVAELDLPDLTYVGDLVVGNSHLKSGFSGSDVTARLNASKNLAYILYHWYGGAGTGTPDPAGVVLDSPPATQVLDGATALVWGGDWNQVPGPNSPQSWLTEAELPQSVGLDGVDRDGGDARYDLATHPISGSTSTRGASKLDYLAYESSVATRRRAFLFDSGQLAGAPPPAETLGFPSPVAISSWAADHLPVALDLVLPLDLGSFCDASDGSLAACPCINPGFPDTGCDIQQQTGGVGLDLLAQSTVPLNRATLRGAGYPTTSTPTAIVIRSEALDPAAPVVFGDGVRCVGLPLVRLAATFAGGGQSVHTFGHGAMAGSGTFYYQLWFRNTPAMFCQGDAFNLSSGRMLDW